MLGKHIFLLGIEGNFTYLFLHLLDEKNKKMCIYFYSNVKLGKKRGITYRIIQNVLHLMNLFCIVLQKAPKIPSQLDNSSWPT